MTKKIRFGVVHGELRWFEDDKDFYIPSMKGIAVDDDPRLVRLQRLLELLCVNEAKLEVNEPDLRLVTCHVCGRSLGRFAPTTDGVGGIEMMCPFEDCGKRVMIHNQALMGNPPSDSSKRMKMSVDSWVSSTAEIPT